MTNFMADFLRSPGGPPLVLEPDTEHLIIPSGHLQLAHPSALQAELHISLQEQGTLSGKGSFMRARIEGHTQPCGQACHQLG